MWTSTAVMDCFASLSDTRHRAFARCPPDPQNGVAGGVAGAGGGVEPSGGAAGGVTGAGDVAGGGGGVDPKDKARLERQARIREANQARKDSAAAARQREKEAADAAKVTPKGKAGTWLKGAQNIIVDLTGHKAQCGPPLAPEMVTMYTGIFEKRMKEVSTLRNNLQELLECMDANADEMVNRELHNAGLLAGNIKTEFRQFQSCRRAAQLPRRHRISQLK